LNRNLISIKAYKTVPQ